MSANESVEGERRRTGRGRSPGSSCASRSSGDGPTGGGTSSTRAGAAGSWNEGQRHERVLRQADDEEREEEAGRTMKLLSLERAKVVEAGRPTESVRQSRAHGLAEDDEIETHEWNSKAGLRAWMATASLLLISNESSVTQRRPFGSSGFSRIEWSFWRNWLRGALDGGGAVEEEASILDGRGGGRARGRRSERRWSLGEGRGERGAMTRYARLVATERERGEAVRPSRGCGGRGGIRRRSGWTVRLALDGLNERRLVERAGWAVRYEADDEGERRGRVGAARRRRRRRRRRAHTLDPHDERAARFFREPLNSAVRASRYPKTEALQMTSSATRCLEA